VVKLVIRPDDGFDLYAYELLFVDDCIYHDAENALYEMDKYLPI